MNRITQKLDLERVALDAYSVVWEPSRKQVRDHQRATKAAIAAVLLHLSEAWSAVPEYQTNGHVQQTVGEFGGRLLIAASDLIGAGEDADLHALLSGEDRSEPTPAPRAWPFPVERDSRGRFWTEREGEMWTVYREQPFVLHGPPEPRREVEELYGPLVPEVVSPEGTS